MSIAINIVWRKPGYASLPARRRGRAPIEKQWSDSPRLYAGSDAYSGRFPDFFTGFISKASKYISKIIY